MICNEKITTNKNGWFERTFCWDTEKIKSLGNGFIIQKIVRKTTIQGEFIVPDSDKFKFNHTYYEAWRVENGTPVYDENINVSFDDQWLYRAVDIIDPLGAMLKDYSSKYESSGTISMTGTLFFVPQKHSVTQAILSEFSSGQVPFAGSLLSSFCCPVENYFSPIFEHSFSHGWKLLDENDFISAVILEIHKSNLSLDDCKTYLQPCFSNLPIYEKLCGSILYEYKTRGDENV